ncbi:NAD-dependent epimerase/dehydratase family protein [Marivirga sp. S37H4]|uniref:NAD-dependent epimerase/dehydratase family protein n=1 Tax=Marivirga aurantiaca TaxID=2802615 RepID=A0A934WZL6_9BACT|nr:NAD-dependent epimerase/dehydratase family protein [Marivirga aurantiaca]MBK6265802.1 NAD-dependent epimerase/dehydratase family protein [Marivirga aurantiaca]
MKTLLLTGATGLLGSNLLTHLLKEDFNIYAVKRPGSDTRLCPQSNQITWITTDNLSVKFLTDLECPIDYIVHAAGLVSYQQKDKEKLFQVNHQFTKKLAGEALKLNVKKFLLVSSISAIGKKADSPLITEDTPWDETQFSSNYGRSKRASENAVKELGEKGLPWIIINPSVIIGPARPDQSSARLIGYVADKKPFYTEGLLNYVDVDDVSGIIIKALKSDFIHHQWILNGGTVTYKHFFTKVAEYLNTKPPKYKIPKAGVMAGAFLENLYSKITGKRSTLSMETAKMAGNSSIYSADKLKSELETQFTPLTDSIKKAVDTMKINGLLKTIFFLASLVDFSV